MFASEWLIVERLQDAFSSPWLMRLSVFFASWAIVVLLAIVVYAIFQEPRGRRKHLIVYFFLCAFVSVFLALSIEELIRRPRPFFESDHIRAWIPPPSTFAFPSGHASLAFALAIGCVRWRRGLGLFALCTAIMISVARVIVGVHYPTDILGGMFVGLCVNGALFWYANRHRVFSKSVLS